MFVMSFGKLDSVVGKDGNGGESATDFFFFFFNLVTREVLSSLKLDLDHILSCCSCQAASFTYTMLVLNLVRAESGACSLG